MQNSQNSSAARNAQNPLNGNKAISPYKWGECSIICFDTETTGIDVENDEIVTVSLVKLTPSNNSSWQVEKMDWLIAVGKEIPQGAIDVHGITNEVAKRDGKDAKIALEQVVNELANYLMQGQPIVAMNACFDLSILDRECRRKGIQTLSEKIGDKPLSPVIDAKVLDKNVDPYRKGGRRLEDLCNHYKATHDGAHDATEDALAAGRVVFKIMKRFPDLANKPLNELHDLQVSWNTAQTTSLEKHFQKSNKDATVNKEWPIRQFNQ